MEESRCMVYQAQLCIGLRYQTYSMTCKKSIEQLNIQQNWTFVVWVPLSEEQTDKPQPERKHVQITCHSKALIMT